MTGYLLAGATALALLASGALAQTPSFDATNSTQPNPSTNGPAGTYDLTTTVRSNDATGVQTDTTESFGKSQTYTNANGELHARTSVQSGTATVTTPPPPVTTTTTSTTTQEVRP